MRLTDEIRITRNNTDRQAQSYSQEAEYDVGNAIHYLSQYRGLGIISLIKAARFIRMAISRHNESEKLFGNTLEEFLVEAEKK